MNHTPAFQQQQRQFLNYLRQPQSSPLPKGFSPERAAVYVELLYNKFDESLSACFPIIRRILSQDTWRALLSDFIAEHRCLTPYYRRIPDEFVQYLREDYQRPDDWPFLAELAHFEWVELQLSIAEAEPFEIEPLSSEQLLTGIAVFTPVMQLLHYRWPVQNINPAFLPTEPPESATFILGFRDGGDRVQFIALNPLSARLVAMLSNGLSGQQALDAIGTGLNDDALKSFVQFGLAVLTELHRRSAIVAVRRPTIKGSFS